MKQEINNIKTKIDARLEEMLEEDSLIGLECAGKARILSKYHLAKFEAYKENKRRITSEPYSSDGFVDVMGHKEAYKIYDKLYKQLITH